MVKYRFVSTLGIADVLLQAFLWLCLMVVTFGLAAPFFIYFMVRLLINTTEVHQIE